MGNIASKHISFCQNLRKINLDPNDVREVISTYEILTTAEEDQIAGLPHNETKDWASMVINHVQNPKFEKNMVYHSQHFSDFPKEMEYPLYYEDQDSYKFPMLENSLLKLPAEARHIKLVEEFDAIPSSMAGAT